MDNRRPLKSRSTSWAELVTRFSVSRGFTPNGISKASVVFATLAGAAFWANGFTNGLTSTVLLIVAALGCQLRLLCNMIDGMVAVEGGKGSPDGPFWNEFPDRLSDIVIIVGVGYGIGAPSLGWAAATFAVLTAYVRELGVTSGLNADFTGPMAKPHRMALITFAALVSTFEQVWFEKGTILLVGLWIVLFGSVLTALRRGRNVLQGLE